MGLSHAIAGLFAVVVVAKPAPQPSGYPLQMSVWRIELGPRPYFLINDMDPGPLKDKLESCSEMEMRTTAFAIGHRGGGTLQFPEETRESMVAGPRMGAGIDECAVVFTSDKQLVCRHDQSDQHTTTNIVNPTQNAKCTTSDITLAEFKSLCGKMDGFNASATTAADYLDGTPPYRTDLYSTCGTVITHKEYIALVDSMGLQFTPELKQPQVPMPFKGSNYTQAVYAQQMVDEYGAAGIAFRRVWPPSFQYADILYWQKLEPAFAERALFLDESGDTPESLVQAVANLSMFAAAGVKIMAPPLYYLVELDKNNKIVPSNYTITAKKLGMKLVTWTFERSGFLGDGSHGGYYYTSIANVTDNDGDAYNLLDVLARDVGVLGVFSDWAASVAYYANCFNIFP